MFNKSKFILSALSAVCGSAALFAANTATSSEPNTPAPVTLGGTGGAAFDDAPIDMKKVSEAFGHFIGRHLKTPNVSFDLDSVIKGIKEGVQGIPAPMTDKEYEQAMVKIQKTSFEKNSKENLQAAEDFIKKIKGEPGVIELEPNKIYYKIVTPGSGPVVEPHGTPQINYTGKFIDGTVFGSSENSGGPVTIPLDQTIPGFSRGIAGMKEGEKRILYVSPELGYGTTGHLPPNSMLIFDIDVVKAKSPDKTDSDDDFDEEEDDDDLIEENDNEKENKDKKH